MSWTYTKHQGHFLQLKYVCTDESGEEEEEHHDVSGREGSSIQHRKGKWTKIRCSVVA